MCWCHKLTKTVFPTFRTLVHPHLPFWKWIFVPPTHKIIFEASLKIFICNFLQNKLFVTARFDDHSWKTLQILYSGEQQNRLYLFIPKNKFLFFYHSHVHLIECIIEIGFCIHKCSVSHFICTISFYNFTTFKIIWKKSLRMMSKELPGNSLKMLEVQLFSHVLQLNKKWQSWKIFHGNLLYCYAYSSMPVSLTNVGVLFSGLLYSFSCSKLSSVQLLRLTWLWSWHLWRTQFVREHWKFRTQAAGVCWLCP